MIPKWLLNLLQEQHVITIHDRGYDNYERMDNLTEQEKGFVICLKKDAGLVDPIHIRGNLQVRERFSGLDKSAKTRTGHRYRIITFHDLEGNTLHVATNMMFLPAEEITELYRSRWQVELLFRWIKQHLNVKNLFGTTPNAVYGQLFSALIAYVLLRWLYTKSTLPYLLQTTCFLQFVRKLWLEKLPSEWQIILHEFIHKQKCQDQYFS